jgi:cobalt-precorrin-5B (C1)-methyltransferase
MKPSTFRREGFFMDLTRSVNGKILRCGYTTGSCAAAAAKAAGIMTLEGVPLNKISIDTPKGVELTLDILDAQISVDFASCAVRKYSGDDPDVTNGALVYAKVERIDRGITIDGGEGVGRATRPGLDQPVGAAAINTTPREMITRELRKAAKERGYDGGFSVVVSVPGGKETAKRTFNPRLGITGGISIIGTTGIVEPMSSQAMSDSVRLQIKQLKAEGARDLSLSPGNYGETFMRETLKLSPDFHVVCSNFIGDAIDAAIELNFRRILLVGHIGKLVKLGIGMTNSHSSFGDGRMETLTACALEAGADLSLLKNVLRCVTTDAALNLIWDAGLLEKTMDELGRRISACLSRRVPESVEMGFVCFTNALPARGVLVKSDNAGNLMETWRRIGD